ncbi:hypothetical protein ACQEVZ_39585 [Dactylosporangium sp. CA-152071]|uniref:hypothetical protein n=1 Tax=Dactylosporangium sp. CA-152071 TaxID=3239933 RepID=UPI003D8F8D55
MFPSTALAPGRPVTRCTGITYSGVAAADTAVVLDAREVSGALADRLRLQVDVGTGGCDNFAGAEMYDGTVAGLVNVPTGWTPAPGERRTFRFTVTLPEDAAADHARASATIQWSVTGFRAAEKAPMPQPPTQTPAQVPTQASVQGPDQQGPDQKDATVARKEGSGTSTIAEVIRDVLDVTNRTRRHSGYLLAGGAILILFLHVQRKVDRRDPKLALAPLTERYAYFTMPAKEPR